MVMYNGHMRRFESAFSIRTQALYVIDKNVIGSTKIIAIYVWFISDFLT